MTDQAKSGSRTCWEYARFRVRTMIVMVLVLGGGLSWFVRRAHDQRDAVESIGRKAGGVQFDWEFENGEDIPDGRPRTPQWRVDRLGVAYFGSVISVNLTECSKSDAELNHAGRFDRLETAELCNADVTDAGLVHLKGLSRLSYRFLSGTNITDAGLGPVEWFWPNLAGASR